LVLFFFFSSSTCILRGRRGGRGGWVTPEYWCSVWQHGSVDRKSGLWEKKRKGGEGGKEEGRKEGGKGGRDNMIYVTNIKSHVWPCSVKVRCDTRGG